LVFCTRDFGPYFEVNTSWKCDGCNSKCLSHFQPQFKQIYLLNLTFNQIFVLLGGTETLVLFKMVA